MADFDPYSILGVTPNAPDYVVQAAYRACLKKFHPDHYKGPDARQKTADILEAYRLIGSSEARADFDRAHGANAKAPHPESSPDRDQSAVNANAPVLGAAPSRKMATVWFVAIAAIILPLGAIALTNIYGSSDQTTSSPAAPLTDASTAASVSTNASIETAPSPPALPSLDGILQFSNPRECEMTAKTSKLFRNLIVFDPPKYIGRRGPLVEIDGFPAPLLPTFSRKVTVDEVRNVRDNEATLALVGLWHGLRVSKIRTRAMEESSFWEDQIRFLEPAQKVRDKLNEYGFDLPMVGEFREYTGDDAVSAGIGVEEISGGSALYCGSSIYY